MNLNPIKHLREFALRKPGNRLAAKVRRLGLSDKWLLLALALGFALGVQGLGWGRYDCLNVDAMAFRNILSKDRPPMHPGSFLKPPFYTYVNQVAARVPASAISSLAFWKSDKERSELYFRCRLLLARALNLALFAGTVALVFAVVRTYYDLAAARVAALLLATSAGFVCYQIFLTTDLALVFMMVATFACACAIARNPSMGLSVAAGLLAGLTTATKYNGLAVAVALPVAHLLGSRGNPVLACLKRPAAWVCGLAVPVGFLAGNPYALLDWPKFHSDFFYNYTTTPVYGGRVEGTGYASFFGTIPEILGWPATVVVICGVLAGLAWLAFGQGRGDAWKLWLLAFAVFALYTWKIGAFPRMTTRFVLPAVPFLLLVAAAGFGALARWKWVFVPALAVALAYNLVCGWWVGELFRGDPRMKMLDVIRDRITGKAVVEVSKSIPAIWLMPGRDIRSVKMPGAIERGLQFDRMFAGNEKMQKLSYKWKSADGPEWFTREARAKRGANWIIWSSKDVEEIVKPEYLALFDPASGYEVVFDGASPVRPRWAYPHQPDFIENRATVWKKVSAPHPPGSPPAT